MYKIFAVFFFLTTVTMKAVAEQAPEDFEYAEAEDEDQDSDIAKLRRLAGRVSGGQVVEEYQIPSHLFIRNHVSKEFVCGAVLVEIGGVHLVVTAASCIYWGIPDPRFSTIPLEELEIIAGSLSKSNHLLQMQMREVKGAHIHHMYEPKTHLNDIAVLHIDPNFLVTKAVQPAILPDMSYPIPSAVQVSGWGNTNITGPFSDVLRYTWMDTIPIEECRNELNLEFNEGQFCARPKNGQENCYGDSGGPVFARKDDIEYLAGIMTKTLDYDCGESNKPVVFTRFVMYKRWLFYKAEDFNQTLAPESDEDVPVPPSAEKA